MRVESSRVWALQQLSRFDLLGADTVSIGMPFRPPTGSLGNGLGPVMEHAPVTFEAMFVNVPTEECVATSQS